MSYSDFTLEKIKQTFEINIREEQNYFANISPLQPSKLLTEILNYNVAIALASNSEKARFLTECSANGNDNCASINRYQKTKSRTN